VILESEEDERAELRGYSRHRGQRILNNALQPDEHQVIGQWIAEGGAVRGDASCERIEHLTRHVLTFVADSPDAGAWERLFVDPADGRLWERTYPHGDMQGCGPPTLTHVPSDVARTKYRLP
jgi:hypothetical protein